MKLNLNDSDPLPVFETYFGYLPLSQREQKEHAARLDKLYGDDWRPTGKPDMWVNGKNQMAYRPATPPEAPKQVDIALPSPADQAWALSFRP